AARPFNSVDECLKVKGVGKSLLTRMQSFAEAQEINSEYSALIPAEEEALPAPVEQNQPAQEYIKDQPSFFTRLGRAIVNFIRALFRLIAIALVIGGIGAGLFYGLPFLNNTLIVPVERNSARIAELSQQVESLHTQLGEMTTQVDALDKTIATHSTLLVQLGELQLNLESQFNNGNEKLAQELKLEIKITRAVEFLSRARLYLSQSNFGLAKKDVQSARDLLAEVQTENPEYKTDGLNQVIARLDLALGNLPAFPVIAVGDVDIALQLLMDSLPTGAAEVAAAPTVTSTPEPVLEVTPTATP
ncbi:MAG: hypothetical protein Q7J80_13300, partial [Anaerolineales bacterium]|nr:hypothetical protein [Anaerolineales bacterium]